MWYKLLVASHVLEGSLMMTCADSRYRLARLATHLMVMAAFWMWLGAKCRLRRVVMRSSPAGFVSRSTIRTLSGSAWPGVQNSEDKPSRFFFFFISNK